MSASSVFAFMYCGCIYESAASPVSLHLSKANAYRAMRKFMLEMAQNERDFALTRGGKQMMRFPVLWSKSFHIQEMEVLP